MSTLPYRVTLVDVGPRDGLQNEKELVTTEHKAQLVEMLYLAGLREIEVTSFVSPKWVPQMADNAAVMAAITRQPGVRYSVLTPNLKGLEAALPTRPDEIVVFAAVSEAFSQKNINCSIAESIERFAPVVAAAHAAGIKVRGALSCAVGCPYEGDISADQVERVVLLMKSIGVEHLGVADTMGLGGCPYAKGATGNVASEDVVFMLNGLGIETGINIDKLVDAGAFISGVLGRPPVSRVARALLAKRAQ